jgi:hypothetical protein
VVCRRPLNLGEVRKELRPWVGLAPNPPPRPPATAYQKDVEPIKRDLNRTTRHWYMRIPGALVWPVFRRTSLYQSNMD